MKCPICKTNKINLLVKNFNGYYSTKHDIYECKQCDIQFASIKNNNLNIYEKIYKTNNKSYNRYLEYAKKIKFEHNPLKWILKQEQSYQIIKRIPKNKNINILEVGCSYGYLTYALYKEGYNIIGIDISREAIKFAKEKFSLKLYINTDITKINQKYDIIIATELIEHLLNYDSFLKKCYKLLNQNGKILLSTPNKSYYTKKHIWITDLPPVHLIWFSKKSIKKIAKENNFDCKFIKMNKFKSNENKLIKNIYLNYFKSKNIVNSQNSFNTNYKIKLIKKISNNKIIKKISNLIYNFFFNEEILGVEFTKK